VPRRPLVAAGYWACQLAGWGLIVILDLTLALGSPPAIFGSFLLLGISTGLSGILVSHGWHAILKANRWLGQTGLTAFLSIGSGIGLASVLQLVCVYCYFNLFLPDLVATGYGWIPSSLLIWLIVFSAWTFLYAAVMAYRRARQLELDKLQLQLLVKDADLRALQAQINPHFFFNSLNSIRALIFEDQAAAANMVDRLAEMMRRSLTSQDKATVPLEAEIAAVSNYLAIEKVRFEDRLQISIEIEAGVGATRIPAMALQTLVENAIKYGVEETTQACTVTVKAARIDEGVAIEVLNQGQLRELPGSTRIGLHNTAQRLQLLFGNAASVALTESDGWVSARILLPDAAAGVP
jgi:hypothetical protein